MSAVQRPAFSEVVLTLEVMHDEGGESDDPITLGIDNLIHLLKVSISKICFALSGTYGRN